MSFLLGLLKNPIVAEWWNARVAPFSAEYFDYIDARMSDAQSGWKIQRVVGARSAPAEVTVTSDR